MARSAIGRRWRLDRLVDRRHSQGWIAVGDPAQILPPDRHEDIWAIQRELDFPGTVYGIPRGTDATTMMRGQSDWYAAHQDDERISAARDISPDEMREGPGEGGDGEQR